jgi:hypothetical protein
VGYRGHRAGLGSRMALPLLAVALATSPCALAQDAKTVQRQAAAAVARGLHINPEPGKIERNLQLLGSPLFLPAGSSLYLVSASKGFTQGTWLLRLDCSSRRDCLPFHALLRIADLGVEPQPHQSMPELPGAPNPHSTPGASAGLLIRSGDRVDLVEQLSGLRLQIKVICLQSGALGERVRVQNPASHRVLLATIAGKDLVRVE